MRAKHNQAGFFVTALSVVLSIIALSFVLGYSSVYARRAAITLIDTQKQYIEEARSRMLEAYESRLLDVDSDLTYPQFRNGSAWLEMAGITEKYNITVGVSTRLSKDNVKYSSVTLWLPNENDSETPPSYNTATGEFTPCSAASCPERIFATFTGYGLQLEARNKSISVINRAATKAQSYFKSRYLTNIIHDFSQNHFRPLSKNCSIVADGELPCADVFTPLSSPQLSPMVALIGLDSGALTNAWGLDIQVNSKDGGASSTVSPFTMIFTTKDPWGGPLIEVQAVQPF